MLWGPASWRRPAGMVCAALLALVPVEAPGQSDAEPRADQVVSADTVAARPGPQYAAGALHERLLGSGYRHLWVAPVRVEVLDLARFAGGLTPIEPGGGRQTRTLHMRGDDGRRYIFRSVDKFPEQVLPDDLRETFVHRLVQDQMSMFHPTGALVVTRLLDPTGLLNVTPRLVVMPDDPRLGEHRAEFAGMLGQIEERPNEGPDGTPGFAGSSRVVGMDRLRERLEEDPAQRPDAREYLTARLTDFVVGDTDRGSDQWRWAAEERPDGGLLFRPIPRDRDFAFVRADGLLSPAARMVFPKMVAFGPSYPSVKALTFSSIHLDRRLLDELPREAWDSVARALQAQLTDEAINWALLAMPPEHLAAEAERLGAALRGRRDGILEIAGRFYDRLAGEVDVRATEEADVLVVDHGLDGSLSVSLSGRTVGEYFHRQFRARETKEVRVYLLEGADRALVRGERNSPIRVRVIGGPGDDVLMDSTSGAAGGISFYDTEGENVFVTGPGTRVDRRDFYPPEDPEGFFARRVLRDRFRDWGGGSSFGPVLDYGEGAGVILGVGAQRTRYGFRRVPFASRLWVDASVASGSGGFGLELGARRARENSPWGASLVLDAEQYHANRFYGFGNAVPEPGDHETALVMQDRIRFTPGLTYDPSPEVRLELGLRARYIDPRPPVGSPLGAAGLFGARGHGTIGGWVQAEVDRTTGDGFLRNGYMVTADMELFPGLWDAPGAFGTGGVEARGYLDLGPTLAMRAGGRKAWGVFPVQDAAFVGGKSSLRGFRYQRFGGDGSIYGSTEMRVPLARVRLLIRGRLGMLGFADAGRVYVDAASPGGWHTGFGAGLSFTTVGSTITASWARGEEQRLYLDLGTSF